MSPGTLNIEQSAWALLNGCVVAVPTEAVWGLSCDPFNRHAVETLLALKQRPVNKGLIIAASSVDQLAPLLSDELSDEQLQKLECPDGEVVSWLVPYSKQAPSWITGQHDLLAVRVTRHPALLAVIQQTGLPLVSTSANPAGCLPARERFQVARYFGTDLFASQGRVGGHDKPSQIRNLLTGEIIRE